MKAKAVDITVLIAGLIITMFGGSMFVNPYYCVILIYIIVYIVNLVVVRMKR